MRVFLGKILGLALRNEATLVRAGRVTFPPTFFQRQIIVAWVHRCVSVGDTAALSPLHQWFWREASGPTHHEQTVDRFWDHWRQAYCVILSEIDAITKREPAAFTELYEIGCGRGLALPLMKKHLAGVERIVGLDLSESQVHANRRVLNGIEYYAGDATHWITEHGSPGAIYVTIGGVFEYFSQHQFEALLHTIARTKSPAVIALTESLPDDYDLESEVESRAFPPEFALGHNYPHLLKKYGFCIEFFQETRLEHRCVVVVASIGHDSTGSQNG